MSTHPQTSSTHGHVDPGYEQVAAAFEHNFSEHGEIGAAFAACVDGKLVVDLWGGVASRPQASAFERDTLVGIFSGSKGLTATCVLMLLERGLLDLEAPVCRYWPQFAANGKQDIRVRDVVCHEAGLPGLLTQVSVEEACDHVRMAELMAGQRPIAAPGDGPQYHAVTFGWLCGELVRRVDGRSVGRFLREEIAAPLNLDIWIGLPAEHEHRVAYLERDVSFEHNQQEFTLDREADEVAWSIWSNPPRFAQDGLAHNKQCWRAAEVPATNGIVAARSLARLYGCLARGGELEGVRLLRPQSIESARAYLARGLDPRLQEELAFGIGYELQTERMNLGPAGDAFGHGGAGGSVHGAWPSLRTGFSYAPNLLKALSEVDPRSRGLLDALHDAVSARTSA